MQTRRTFVRTAGSTALAVVLAPQAAALGLTSAKRAPLAGKGAFAEGVISGDPGTNAITLWTRLDDVAGSLAVDLEVATDKGFRKVIAKQRIATSDAIGHAIKARVTGLKTRQQYYYRFATKTTDSPVGQFRTAPPAGSTEPVTFAYWSCQEFAHGWYNAHELMAKDDLDFVICLGDYIYAETYSAKSIGRSVREDPIGKTGPNPDIVREALTLQDYRDKYKLYRSDKSLQKMHQQFPMLTLWDDHEIQDNYAGKPADGGLPPEKRYSAARRKAATQAFFESQPFFKPKGTKLYRTIPYGKNVEVFVMDQRQYRDNQPCDDKVVPACDGWDAPRDFLGRTQLNWLKGGLSKSKANWKVMANELTIMPTKVTGDAFFTFDGWQGYPQEREELLKHIDDQAIKDVVFVTGDIHTFIAGDVQRGFDGKGKPVALEFVGGSVTSQGLGETDIDAGGGIVIKGNDAKPSTPTAIIDVLRGINSWVDNADFDHHGYGKITARKDGLTSELVRLDTIKKKSTKTLPTKGFKYEVARGQTSIKGKAS